jgi:ABC-type transport system involved in cytochrome c biogenesis permease subunit
MLFFPTLLIIVALFIALKNHSRWHLLKILGVILTVGILDFALHLYFLQKTNCGAQYNSDIGCLDVLPEWFTVLGLILLAVATIVSLLIISLSMRDKFIKH